MTAAIAHQVGLICLLVIAVVLWADDSPHRRRGWRNHPGCDVCRTDPDTVPPHGVGADSPPG